VKADKEETMSLFFIALVGIEEPQHSQLHDKVEYQLSV